MGHYSTGVPQKGKEEWCKSVRVVAHETFDCMEVSPIGGEHELPHRGSYILTPCLACGGMLDHSSECPKMGETDSGGLSGVLCWDDSWMWVQP